MIDKLRKFCRKYLNRANLLALIKKIGRVVFNPRLFLCLGMAWMITNGWSYVFFGLGTAAGINWMRNAGAAWMMVLWLPFTPEKILTVIIAIFLMRLLFPNDEKTLGTLKRMYAQLKEKHFKKKAAKEARMK